VPNPAEVILGDKRRIVFKPLLISRRGFSLNLEVYFGLLEK